MKIAICIYGFPRYIYSSETLKSSLKNALPNNLEQLDIFWSCPNILVPDATEKFNTEELESNYKNTELGNICMKFFEYDVQPFYKKVSDLNFSIDDLRNSPKSHSALVSLFYNISNSVSLAYEYSQKNNISYDWVILTRNDLIPFIKNFGIQKDLKEGIYNYRTCPYRTNSEQVNLAFNEKGLHVDLLDSEDRAFFGSPDYMFTFRCMYDDYKKVLVKPYYYIELLLTQFITHHFGKEQCRYIEGSKIEFPEIPNSYQAKKITQEELDYHIKYVKQ
jgi:hypothetical protein